VLAGWGSALNFRTPVAERLERNRLSLAILSLIQLAPLPCLMVCPPERLAVAPARQVLVRHLVLPICKLIGEKRSRLQSEETSVREINAYQ
jgi:hypothetical protein